MPYDVNIQEEEGYLRVEVEGQRIPGKEEEDAIGAWSLIAKACKEKQLDLVLSIYNVTGRLPTRAAHAIGYNPARIGWSRNFKAAVVVSDEESRQDTLFVEDVAVSSGYRIRIFDDEQKAKVWLFER